MNSHIFCYYANLTVYDVAFLFIFSCFCLFEFFELMSSFAFPHIASFNFVIDHIVEIMVKNLPSLELKGPRNERISLFIEELKFFSSVDDDVNSIHNLISTSMLPMECKLRGQSYFCVTKLMWCLSEDGVIKCQTNNKIDQMPIMVMSNLCKLYKLTDFELHKHGQEMNEAGGYFIVNGQEKLVRLLLVQRQNFPIALIRDVWMHKGDSFSDKGVIIRCVTQDFSVSLMTFHFLINGFCSISISRGGHAFSVPFMYILKALVEASDFEIFQQLMFANPIDNFLEGCVVAMLRSSLQSGLLTQSDFLCYLGNIYRLKFDFPEWYSDIDIGRLFLNECVCIHLNDPVGKFHLLIEICHKLYSLAQNTILPDNADSPMFQEVLLPGFVYLSVLRSAVINWLKIIRSEFEKYLCLHPQLNYKEFANTFKGIHDFSTSISNRLINFIATGNATRDVLGLPQNKGLTILADKVNYHRYFSHFCSIHRGHFFTEVRTTTVRKLLPDAMGFICPVNTPDGTPCGLLTHLTKSSFITIGYESIVNLKRILLSKGMVPIEEFSRLCFLHQEARKLVRIFLDGSIIGYFSCIGSLALVNALRHLKVMIDPTISPNLEIVFPSVKFSRIFRGIFIFSSPGRFMRPLYNIYEQAIEMVGSFEQVR